MTNETATTTSADQKQIPFCVRLKNAREAMGLERKDAAEQLRLNEKIIIMMEKDRYPVDLPVTFIRGYLRAYSKLLEIPDHEIKKAIEPIKQRQGSIEPSPAALKPIPITSSNYLMQILTYLIVLTLLVLVATWWYTSTNPSNPVADTVYPQSPQIVPERVNSPVVQSTNVNQPSANQSVRTQIQPHAQVNTNASLPTQANSNTSFVVKPTVTQPQQSEAKATTVVQPLGAQPSPALPSINLPSTTQHNDQTSASIKNPPTRVENKPTIRLPSPVGNTATNNKATKRFESLGEEEYPEDVDNVEINSDNIAD